MTASEAIEALPTALVAVRDVVGQLTALVRAIRGGRFSFKPDVSYENLSLNLLLDIRDRKGAHAVLVRRQRVRFLRNGERVVRDLVWGDGHLLARYTVAGARRLSVIPEGSKRALLLVIPNHAAKTGCATIQSRRLIRNGLLSRTEYCETLVERPTRRLAMKVIFPADRPPNEVQLATVPAQQVPTRLAIRIGADGRPYLAWRTANPAPNTLYSLRWSW